MGIFGRKKATPVAASTASDTGRTSASPELPAEISDPGLPEDHPRQMFHRNLTVADSMTWYSKADSPAPVLAYVLSLLDLSPDDLRYAEQGFAQNIEQTLLLIGLSGPTISSVTVWAMDGGAHLLNAALEREWAVMTDQLSRGEWKGHPADSVRILHGEVHEDHGFKAAEVRSFINAGQVVSLRP